MTKHKQDKQSKHTLKTPHTHTTNSVLADEQVSMFHDNESHPNLLKSYHANICYHISTHTYWNIHTHT